MRRLIVSLCAVMFPGGAMACPAYQQAETAYAATDHAIRIEALRAAAGSARRDGFCSADHREQVERWASLALYQYYTETGQDWALDEAAAYSRQWLVRSSLGDRERERRNHEAAARQYQTALNDIDYLHEKERMGVQFGDPPPSAQQRREIKAWAEEMQLLLGRIVAGDRATCAFEDIAPGAGLAPAVYPITFSYDSDQMTPAGVEAADVLKSCLAQLPPGTGEVAVIGHADPQGDDAYNCGLSIRRAQAVVNYLRASSIVVPLRAVGRGEEQPYRPQGGNYTTQERYAMSRRVEADVPEPGLDTSFHQNCRQ